MLKWLLYLLAFTLLAAELHQFFPSKVYLHFYHFSPNKTESIRWFVTAIVDRVTWIITMTYLWSLLRKFKPEIAPYALIFVLYRGLDLVAYILNGGIAGKFYLIVYVPIIIYALIITYKRQIRDCGEWLYSKRKNNGNNDLSR